MQIIQFWPADGPGDTVAHFDIEILDGLRLNGLRLIDHPRDGWRTQAPKMGTRRAATFTPRIASLITRAAVAHLKGEKPYELRAI